MRKNPPAKWVLPDVVNPTDTVCFKVKVPNNKFHIAAFRGAMQALASAYKWQDDLAHTAKDVAQVWRKVADEIEKCGDNPTPTTKFIEEWEDDLTLHCNIRWHDGVLQVTNGCDCDGNPIWSDVCGKEGTDSGNSQPGGTTRPDAGKSKCYSFTLNANGTWKLPFYVRDGDIITITNAEGGMWSDGTPNWYCPDGNQNILGVCTGIHATDGGDPDPSIDHMRVIYSVGSTFYDGYNTTNTLPDGTGNQDLIFQANDASLSDNQGSVTLTVCVENGSTPADTGWCKAFDFTVSDWGWNPLTDGINPVGQYNAGVGWGDTGNPLAVGMQIFAPIAPPDTVFTRCVVQMDAQTSGDPSPRCFGMNSDGSVDLGGGIVDDLQIYDFTFTSPYTGTRVLIVYGPGSGSPTPYIITAITLHGTGPNPYGADNC